MPMPKLEFTTTRLFSSWLNEQNASICASTYQTGILFMMGLRPDGTMSYFTRAIPRCMGLSITERTLWVGSMFQLHRFENTLRPGERYQEFDAYFVPRVSHTTGDVDIHDVDVDKDGRAVFVNTLYSCLATVDERYSFRPLWKPPFISRLAAEDRCHLNGLAVVDGEARYVTCISKSDAAGGWRDFRESGGLVLRVPDGEVVCSGLSMPHSPRWHKGKLWIHNSGTGHFGYVDFEKGRFEPVAFCPGYLRGMSFIDDYAIVGVSVGRENTFGGLPLQDNLEKKGVMARCAIQVISLKNGDIPHEIRFTGDIRELFDVAVIPNIRLPGAVGFRSDEIWRRIDIESDTIPASA
jgi:uncharacterized protein (TIGR03032 family)